MAVIDGVFEVLFSIALPAILVPGANGRRQIRLYASTDTRRPVLYPPRDSCSILAVSQQMGRPLRTSSQSRKKGKQYCKVQNLYLPISQAN